MNDDTTTTGSAPWGNATMRVETLDTGAVLYRSDHGSGSGPYTVATVPGPLDVTPDAEPTAPAAPEPVTPLEVRQWLAEHIPGLDVDAIATAEDLGADRFTITLPRVLQDEQGFLVYVPEEREVEVWVEVEVDASIRLDGEEVFSTRNASDALWEGLGIDPDDDFGTDVSGWVEVSGSFYFGDVEVTTLVRSDGTAVDMDDVERQVREALEDGMSHGATLRNLSITWDEEAAREAYETE